MKKQILLTDGTVKEINGHNLKEFDQYGFSFFYYKNIENEFVITEASTGIAVSRSNKLKLTKEQVHNKFVEVEDFKEKLDKFIKKHFTRKYFKGVRLVMLNNTSGGMFKESKV